MSEAHITQQIMITPGNEVGATDMTITTGLCLTPTAATVPKLPKTTLIKRQLRIARALENNALEEIEERGKQVEPLNTPRVYA
jgi:hypothetical protein